jgi:hypothetical protein
MREGEEGSLQWLLNKSVRSKTMLNTYCRERKRIRKEGSGEENFGKRKDSLFAPRGPRVPAEPRV